MHRNFDARSELLGCGALIEYDDGQNGMARSVSIRLAQGRRVDIVSA